jgi:hypothetical protein
LKLLLFVYSVDTDRPTDTHTHNSIQSHASKGMNWYRGKNTGKELEMELFLTEH